MTESKIKVTGLKKSFGENHVLKGIDIEINAGEVVCVIGPSGSGKSSLLQLLGADPYRHQMRGAAGRTLARDRALAVAMVAA